MTDQRLLYVGQHVYVGEELARLLPRTRAQIVAPRATVARQIKATLHQFGLIAPGRRRLISHRYLRELEAWSLPGELRVSLAWLAEQWRFAMRQLLDIRRLLREQAHAQQELERVYRSVPGIGAVAARTLATALSDMTRFANERALFSSTELPPSEYSSGAAVRRGPRSVPAEWDVRPLGSVRNGNERRRCAVPLLGEVCFFSRKFT